MKRNKYYIFILFIGIISLNLSLKAQEVNEEKSVDHSYKPLTLKLTDDGKKYIRFITWHQLWLEGRSDQNGPAFSIRRSRFLAFAQISPKFLILTHWGLNSLSASNITANPNSQTANNRSLLFLHDAWGEFQIINKKLYVGSGLHYWNGISRLTNQSTLNMMTLDNPGQGTSDVRLFPWATITQSDQFARHLGIYAKGSLGKFGYRISLNNARANQGTLNSTIPSYQVTGRGVGSWNIAGYFKFDFLDKESDKLPYLVGTYLGKKKVLSLGAGFFTQPNALAIGTTLDNATRSAVSHFAVDLFYDAPLSDNIAINALGAFYNFSYGGDDNFASGGLVPGGGSIFYGQIGVLFRSAKLMPYVTYHTADVASTPNNSAEFTAGLNYFINGHHAKLTAEYASGSRGTEGSESTSIFKLQMHIFL